MDDYDLTGRQIDLLKAIIQEFMDTAEAVGSIHLPTKYNIRVSPATIRNEMINLANKGYVRKSHASSGRIPTSRAFKYFIEELLGDLNDLDTKTEAIMKEQIFQNRFNQDRLLYNACRKLSELTDYMSIVVTQDRVFTSGISDIVEFYEYQEPERLRQFLSILEDSGFLQKLFGRAKSKFKDTYVLIGKEDTGLDYFEEFAVVFADLALHAQQGGYIGTIGPARMNYADVIPAVRWTADTINSSVSGW
jgi:heat-inducible transcriptional repressor